MWDDPVTFGQVMELFAGCIAGTVAGEWLRQRYRTYKYRVQMNAWVEAVRAGVEAGSEERPPQPDVKM